MAKVELESKLTSGFPAMTATVQVHRRGPSTKTTVSQISWDFDLNSVRGRYDKKLSSVWAGRHE